MATIILPPGSSSGDLQAAIDLVSFGDVIELSSDMPFTNTVSVRNTLEVTIRSCADCKCVMYQFAPRTRHFEVSGSLILEEITLDGKNSGGGVQLNQGALALNGNADIQNCSADIGGGVYIIKGVFSLYGGTIRNNNAEKGGGVYLTAGMFNMSASRGIISDNSAITGGGVYLESGTYMLSGGELCENNADYGAGLYLGAGIFNMTRGELSGNTANVHGGGIYLNASASAVLADSAKITGNTAITGHGGGIYTNHVTLANISTTNTLFACNIASAAHKPPDNADLEYPGIKYSAVTVENHPLNNFDINYTAGQVIDVTHRLRYDANGGTGGILGPPIGPCESDTVYTPSAAQISKPGFIFTAWNTERKGTGDVYYPGDELIIEKDITLFAQWEREECPPVDDCLKLSRDIAYRLTACLCIDPCSRARFADMFACEFCRQFCGKCR